MKQKIVVAIKQHANGKVLPGRTLSEKPHRELEHAFHALPRLALAARLNNESVGVFCDGQHVPSEQTQMVV